MKKLIPYILYAISCFFAVVCVAQLAFADLDTLEGLSIDTNSTIEGTSGLDTIEGSGVAGGCSTPSLGANLTEGFEGTGYENTWTEHGTPNEDYSNPGSPPSGGCSESVYIDANETEEWITYDHGSTIDLSSTAITIEFYIYISTNLDIGENIYLYSFGTDASSPSAGYAAYVRLFNNGGTTQVRADGNVASNYIDISTPGQWNKITLHLHTTAASSYIAVNDGTQETFTRQSSSPRYHHVGAPLGVGTGEVAVILYDLFEY